MAIIYTYPTKNATASDKILISDSEDELKTKQAPVSSIKDAIDVVDSITATSPIIASSLTGNVNISSTPYSGGNNVGYVPIGGTNSTFLKGDGTWGSSSTSLTLTTQGSTGPATWNGTTLNIPEYITSSGTVSSITATPASYQGVEYVSISNLSSAVGNVNLGFVGLTATNFGGSAPDPGLVDCRFLIKDNYWASLWPAQQNFLGGIALSSATVQTVAPNAVSSTASKTYSVQLDANNKAVVNVPWTSGGGGTALRVGNQGAYFTNETALLNFKNGDWSTTTASSSNNGSQVNIETTPLTGFSPAPLYQVTKNIDFVQTVIGMYVPDNNVKVNKVKFMASNFVDAEPTIPICYIAIYSIGTSIFGAAPSFQTPEAVFQLDAASKNPPGGLPLNEVGIRSATIIYDKNELGYFQYPVGRQMLISVTAKNLAIGGVEAQANLNYTRASDAYIGDYGVGESGPGFTLARVLEDMVGGDVATLVPGLQFFYDNAPNPALK